MSITFACERCGQRYQVDPALAGKKIRCKGCGEAVRIPGPRPAAPPEAERPDRPSRKATPAPALAPSWLDEADEEGSGAPALPRAPGPKTTPRAGRSQAPARSSGLDPATVKSLAIAGAAVAGLIVVVLLGSLLLGGSGAAIAAHERVVRDGLVTLDDLTQTFSTITDQDSARRATGRVEIAARALAYHAAQAGKLPDIPPKEERRLADKYREQTEASRRKWRQEFQRIKTLPGVPEALRDALVAAETPGT